MSELKIGDVVKLKSGSPDMVIDNIDRKGIAAVGDKALSTDTIYAWVSWFDKNGKPHKKTYPLTSLKKAGNRHRPKVDFLGM